MWRKPRFGGTFVAYYRKQATIRIVDYNCIEDALTAARSLKATMKLNPKEFLEDKTNRSIQRHKNTESVLDKI